MKAKDVTKVDLFKELDSDHIDKVYVCTNLLSQLAELSEIYDVIIDNGKVILSEKS